MSLSACTGAVEPGPAGPGLRDGSASTAGNGSGDVEGAASFLCDREAPVDPGPAPLKRLTPGQYAATLHDLFGTDLSLDDVLPAEATNTDIGLAQADPSQLDVETYLEAARRVGAHVESHVDDLAPCTSKQDASAAKDCARSFLSSFGTRIYRSPLSAQEIDDLLSVFEVGYGGGGYGHAMGLMTRAMVAAPRFLYRPEVSGGADGDGMLALSPYELASRLSFAFWNQGPDRTLLDAAAAGELDDVEGIAHQAERLMADPRADRALRDFLRVWFGLSDLGTVEKDPSIFPMWSEQMRASLAAQADAFFDAVLFGKEGNIDALFAIDARALGPSELSEQLGESPAGATGLLTLPAILARHAKPTESFPIYRGLFVRQQLLCQPLPPPPPNVGDPPPPARGVSTRERFEQHSSDPACTGCHTRIDPLGFAFEHYDALGRYREEEDGRAIDASGMLTGTDVDGPFDDLAELSSMLQSSDTLRACATRQWFRFVMERFEQPSDGCSMKSLKDAFAESGYRFAALRTAIVQTPAFRMRRPIQLPEESP